MSVTGEGDEGTSRLAVNAHDRGTRIGPSGIVVAIVAATVAAIGGQILDRRLGIRGLVSERNEVAVFLFDGVDFLLGHDEMVTILSGSFEPRERGVAPGALEVRPAVGA